MKMSQSAIRAGLSKPRLASALQLNFVIMDSIQLVSLFIVFDTLFPLPLISQPLLD